MDFFFRKKALPLIEHKKQIQERTFIFKYIYKLYFIFRNSRII